MNQYMTGSAWSCHSLPYIITTIGVIPVLEGPDLFYSSRYLCLASMAVPSRARIVLSHSPGDSQNTLFELSRPFAGSLGLLGKMTMPGEYCLNLLHAFQGEQVFWLCR